MGEQHSEAGDIIFNDSLLKIKEVKGAVTTYLANLSLPEDQKKQLYDRYLNDIKKHADRCRFTHEKISKEMAKTLVTHALSKLESYAERFLDDKDERINPFLLTKSAMRRSFDNSMAENKKESDMKRTYLVLVSIDADDFKKINNTFNHEVGDSLLRSIGSAIDSVIRPETDFAAHYSGDEFGFMLNIHFDKNLSEKDDEKKITEIIKDKISKIQAKIKRPDNQIQELSTGFKIIDINNKNDFGDNLAKSDEASELAKRIRIVEEGKGNNVSSPDRIINSTHFEQIEGGYSKEEMAIAKAERSLRRALTELEETLNLKGIKIHEEVHKFILGTIERGQAV